MIELKIYDHNLFEDYFQKNFHKIEQITEKIKSKQLPGIEFLGWENIKTNVENKEFLQMKEIALKWQKILDYVVVVGIGGSYLGPRMVLEIINGLFPSKKQQKLQFIYAGIDLSENYLKQILNLLKDKKFGVCLISKSGTTLEPNVAFHFLKALLIEQHHENAKNYIVSICGAQKNLLRTRSQICHYPIFSIPKDVGGRYSVLTAVGVFIFLLANINVNQLWNGALQAKKDAKNLKNFSAFKYAMYRYYNFKELKKINEIFINYEPSFNMFGKWWQQLFGESEGKNKVGLFPISANFSTDLHSLGQFIQEGKNSFFETTLKIKHETSNLILKKTEKNLDNLNILSKFTFNDLNQIAMKGVLKAHFENAKINNVLITLENSSEFSIGYLIYWFFLGCTYSGYLLKINPFNQPGVEVYKQYMKNLLNS